MLSKTLKKLSHNWLRALGTQLISFLSSQHAGDISHKSGGRLPLFYTRPVVTFSAKEITPLGRYKIILLADIGTQMSVACPRPLHNGAQPGLEPVTYKLQVQRPTNSTTVSIIEDITDKNAAFLMKALGALAFDM